MLWVPRPVHIRVYIFDGTMNTPVGLLPRTQNNIGYVRVAAGVMGYISTAHDGGTRNKEIKFDDGLSVGDLSVGFQSVLNLDLFLPRIAPPGIYSIV